MNQNMDNEIWKALQSADWGRIHKELLLFTLYELNQYSWESGSRDQLPKGNMPNDIVQEVILRTIEGKRRWDPAKGPIIPWLKSQVRSLVNALVNSAAHRHEERPPESETRDGEELDSEELLVGKMAEPELLQTLEPMALLMESERNQIIQQKRDALIEATYEPELLVILDAIMDGCEPQPRHLATVLKTDATEINNRLKRLRRRALTILKEERHDK